MNKNTPVSALMTKKVVVAHTDKHQFTQVKELFLKHKLHHLPITDNNDKVLGIISSHDVLKAYDDVSKRIRIFDDAILNNEVKLSDIMTKNPDTIGMAEPIGKVAQLFARKKYHALPVVENGIIKGIITSNDLVKFILR